MNARVRVFVACLTLAGAAVPGAVAQEAARTDSDPTRPILFSVRPEYYSLGDGIWRAQVVARYDTAVVRQRRWFSGKRGMLLRFEVPVVTADTPSIDTQAGLGDAYGQVLVVPYLSGRFAFVGGSGLSFPTATDTALGTGKWVLSPAIAPVWFLRGRGMFYVKAQNFSSVAGDAARPGVNFLLITPTLITTTGRQRWILIDSETKTDWNNGNKTSLKSGVQFGWLLPDGLGFWIKPEIFWGPNSGGQWTLKTGLVWYRNGG